MALGGLALLVGGCAAGVGIGGSTSGDGDAPRATTTVTVSADSGARATATVTTQVTVTAAAESDASADSSGSSGSSNDGNEPSVDFPKQSGDWRLDSLQLKDDGLGDFGGTGRITYTGDDGDGGTNVFTVTVFDQSGAVIATVQGSASEVPPGQTVTTQFVGSDDFQSGDFAVTFQKDF